MAHDGHIWELVGRDRSGEISPGGEKWIINGTVAGKTNVVKQRIAVASLGEGSEGPGTQRGEVVGQRESICMQRRVDVAVDVVV